MNPRFQIALTGALLALSSLASQAVVTVQLNGGLGTPQLVSSTGVPLPDGSRVRVGSFASGFDLAAHADDFAALEGAFRPFGESSTTTLAGEAGRLADAFSHTDASFDNERIFLWAFDGPEDEYAIFSSDAPAWHFPTEGAAMTSTLISTSEINRVVHGEILPGELKLAIRLPDGAGAVPEPSFLLGWLVLMGGLLRRRTRG